MFRLLLLCSCSAIAVVNSSPESEAAWEKIKKVNTVYNKDGKEIDVSSYLPDPKENRPDFRVMWMNRTHEGENAAGLVSKRTSIGETNSTKRVGDLQEKISEAKIREAKKKKGKKGKKVKKKKGKKGKKGKKKKGKKKKDKKGKKGKKKKGKKGKKKKGKKGKKKKRKKSKKGKKKKGKKKKGKKGKKDKNDEKGSFLDGLTKISDKFVLNIATKTVARVWQIMKVVKLMMQSTKKALDKKNNRGRRKRKGKNMEDGKKPAELTPTEPTVGGIAKTSDDPSKQPTAPPPSQENVESTTSANIVARSLLLTKKIPHAGTKATSDDGILKRTLGRWGLF